MNNYKTRISRGIVGFDVDIRLTYEYLMKTCPPPEGYYNWQRLSWLPDEIAQWGRIILNGNLYTRCGSTKKGHVLQ